MTPLRHAVFCAVLVAASSPGAAQDQRPDGALQEESSGAEPRPRFETASIKRNQLTRDDWSFGAQRGSRWSMVNRPIATLIRAAYPAPIPDLIGAPEWVTSDTYDITATAEGDATPDEIRLMLQTLLAERFGLVAHYEAQVRPVFALVVARRDGRPGPGLVKSTLDCDAVNAAIQAGRKPESPVPANGAPLCAISLQQFGSEMLLSGGRPMSALAEWLQQPSGRIVVDKTGLTGNYEFMLLYTSKPRPGNDTPSVFTALEDHLGLKLVPEHAPLTVLVVDEIERPKEY